MREQRLDQEDIVADITKTCETVKKEQEMLKQKLKRVEQSLAATQNDIREFQMEKQAKLNEIQVMIMLYAHQIEYLEDDRLPADMSNAVVFSNDELARLRRRIDVRPSSQYGDMQRPAHWNGIQLGLAAGASC